jgi:cell division protein FtsB
VLGLPPLPSKYKGVIVVGVLVLSAVLISAVFGKRGWVHLRELDKNQRELESLALRLQRENDQRQEHLRRLANDDVYLEKLVRERLGWVKPGETVYRVRSSRRDGKP